MKALKVGAVLALLFAFSASAETVTFQNGVDEYLGTTDVYGDSAMLTQGKWSFWMMSMLAGWVEC